MSIYEGFDPSQVPEPFGNGHEPKHPPADMVGLDGLVERLLNLHSTFDGQGGKHYTAALFSECATAIQSLTAQLANAKVENERLHGLISSYRLQIDQIHDRAALKGSQQ